MLLTRIVSGSSDKTICIWDASNGTLPLTWQSHPDGNFSITYSHDGSYILSRCKDGTIQVRDVSNGKLIKAYEDCVTPICFSPDDTYFVSGSQDETIRLWNISTEELLLKANVSSFVISVVLLPSSDSKYIKFASASLDGLIRIWDVDVGLEERTWNTPNRDGWVIGNDGNLLSWIPSDIRPTLIGGPCIRILNSRFSTILELSKYQGNHWTSCFPSSTII